MTDVDLKLRERAYVEIVRGARNLDEAHLSLQRAARAVSGTSIADALSKVAAAVAEARKLIDVEAA